MRRLLALALAFTLVGMPGLATAAPARGDWTIARFSHVMDDTRSDPGQDDQGKEKSQGRDDDRNRPPRAPNGESPNFTLFHAVRWQPGPKVEYRIVGAPFPGAARAIESAVATVDRYVTTRRFARDDRSRQVSPCTGEPNSIRWGPLDGPKGELARTDLCYNLATHEIGGFVITFDSADGWVLGPDGNQNTFDLQIVATHEMGHVAGLDHVSTAQDTCLTMYPLTGPEETQKRTLGWGDKLGLNVLYHHGDVTPGPGCGR